MSQWQGPRWATPEPAGAEWPHKSPNNCQPPAHPHTPDTPALDTPPPPRPAPSHLQVPHREHDVPQRRGLHRGQEVGLVLVQVRTPQQLGGPAARAGLQARIVPCCHCRMPGGAREGGWSQGRTAWVIQAWSGKGQAVHAPRPVLAARVACGSPAGGVGRGWPPHVGHVRGWPQQHSVGARQRVASSGLCGPGGRGQHPPVSAPSPAAKRSSASNLMWRLQARSGLGVRPRPHCATNSLNTCRGWGPAAGG